MQNNHQYLKDNSIRKCLKYRKNVITGSNKYDYKQLEYHNSRNDPAANAYYIGDRLLYV
jgi:hypothetical protein